MSSFLQALALVVPGTYLAIPTSYVLLRSAIARRVAHSLAQGKSLATDRLDRALTSTLVEIGINVVVLLLALFSARHAGRQESAILVTTTVYMGTVVRSIFKFIVNLRDLVDFTRYILAYRAQGPHQWVAAQIAPEVHRHYDAMPVWDKVLYVVGGGPSRHQYIELQTRVILDAITRKLVSLLAIFTIYVVLFRFVAAPILMEDTTGFGALQAFLWPFAYSIDHFVGSDLSGYIRAADYLGVLKALTGQGG